MENRPMMTLPFSSPPPSLENFPFSFTDHYKDGNNLLGMKMETSDFRPNYDINPQQSLAFEGGSSSGIGIKHNKIKETKEKKLRRHRYAFHTRSQVDILDDGYRWRKYGQKAVKNNKFPRSYYRCTHPGCNVKKQVQRLANDEEIVVTTYEGVHTHPVERSTDNFEHILKQMQIYVPP